MQRDDRTVGSLMQLAMEIERYGKHGAFQLIEHRGMHTSDLWTGRAQWLRNQIADVEVDVAISVDTDTSFNPMRLLIELPRVTGAVDVAIGLCPVRVGGLDAVCNFNVGTEADSKRIRMAGLAELLNSDKRDIESGGFGVAVFNLAWYRAHWELPSPELVGFKVGEDIAHCRSVRRRGGRVIGLAVQTAHYAYGEVNT
jgi:hypothetical protein